MLVSRLANKGFTVIETAIAIGALVILIVIGLALYSHDHSPQAIIVNRQKSVDSYIKHLNISNYSNLGNSLYSKNLITTSLFNTTQSLISSYGSGNFTSNAAYSNLICVDQVPYSFTYGPVIMDSNNTAAHLSVNVFLPGSFRSIPYTAYWVETGGTWELNNVKC